MKKALVGVLFLLIFPSSAGANYYCVGKVGHLGVGGALNVNNGYGIHRLCDLAEDRCKAWLSILTAAKLTDRTVHIYYRNPDIGGNQSEGACHDIGHWVTPEDSVYYINF